MVLNLLSQQIKKTIYNNNNEIIFHRIYNIYKHRMKNTTKMLKKTY